MLVSPNASAFDQSPEGSDTGNTLSPPKPARLGVPGWIPAPTVSQLTEKAERERSMALLQPSLGRFWEDHPARLWSTASADLAECYEKAWDGLRLTAQEALLLLTQGDLQVLGVLATQAKERFHVRQEATFLIDRNINYTNICRIGCDFCAFYRKEGDTDAYVLKTPVLLEKIQETIELGGTGVLLQGGVNPKLKIDYYEDLFSTIKSRFNIHLHALSVIEIEGIAQVSRLTIAQTLGRLKAAGLDSIPGAGAEILVDDIRLNQSPVKRHAKRWISVMQEAHAADIPTTATMMFGALEEPKHIIEHVDLIRRAQDETGGFYSFIMWTFQGENTALKEKHPQLLPATAVDYLKVVAVSRIMLDNIPNIQGSWVTMSPKIGQASLHYGANDMGSLMIEENVVSAAGTHYTLDRQAMCDIIESAGFRARQRDTYYRPLGTP